jgi:hypothetical protein
MKYALLAVIWLMPLGAQQASTQSLNGTFSNVDKEPAPYIPDDSLPYSATPVWPDSQAQPSAPVLFVPAVVAPTYEAPVFVDGGCSRGFHPSPTVPVATITGRPFGPGTHHSGRR